ncbi:MAG: hypothetical protein D6693_09370 [Planctomycetota bacterium]|nr:MAG: hypothetical protein D6693_09370 [Planctomycetota bacterium]
MAPGGSLIAAALLSAAMLTAGGCNIVAPVAYAIQGPPTTPALHTLDGSRTTVVFIDDRLNRVPRRSLRLAVAEEVEQALMRKGVLSADRVITTRAIMREASNDRFSAPRTVAQLGRDLGAEVVIYATIDSWTPSPDGVTLAPSAAVRVKVIDAAEDRRIWPPDGAGHRVVASLPPQTRGVPSGADLDRANAALALMLGQRIARVFFEHQRDALSGRLDD